MQASITVWTSCQDSRNLSNSPDFSDCSRDSSRERETGVEVTSRPQGVLDRRDVLKAQLMVESAKEKISRECDTSEDESCSSGDEDSTSESSHVHTDIETEERMLREEQELRQLCEEHYILLLDDDPAVARSQVVEAWHQGQGTLEGVGESLPAGSGYETGDEPEE